MRKALTEKLQEEIDVLTAMNDNDIDYSDIPPVRDFSDAQRGKFYRPVKQAVTLRLDADVIAWLKAGGRGYQTRLNNLLRSAMEHQPAHHTR